MRECFLPANILLPPKSMLENWAVIACDQHTSDRTYWESLYKQVGESPSVLHMILPEAFLDDVSEGAIRRIHINMHRCLKENILIEHPEAFIYVERTLVNGLVRQGIVGMIDLEQYDYRADSGARIRATEETVFERIPPRVAVRKDAPLEFSHVIVFCDDWNKRIIEPLSAMKDSLPQLYDFELSMSGGHISGWLVQGVQASKVRASLNQYADSYDDSTAYLVADGNHSLVTAKQCYSMLPKKNRMNHPSRYAMVELENIHSNAIVFEPIHRFLCGVDADALLQDLQRLSGPAETQITWFSAERSGTIRLRHCVDELPVAALQRYLDDWLTKNAGSIDYIHDDDVLVRLAAEDDCLGLRMPKMNKSALFTYVAEGNTLPRKTFSLGHAAEKRYYLEGRKIL